MPASSLLATAQVSCSIEYSSGTPLAGVFRITASTCSLARVRRWRDESTPLRAYLSCDGAIMLADPALGGNAPCEPPTPDTYHARDQATPTTTRQPRRNNSAPPASSQACR